MPIRAVLMNDTRADRHFGCLRVMRLIEKRLAGQGIEIAGRSPIRNDWENDRAFLDAMGRSDLVVINGEGTFHHGAQSALRLLKVVDHPARAGKPVALINTLYQDNPKEWRRYLDKIALVSARDSRSAAEIEALTGRRTPVVPDMSLSDGMLAAPGGPGRDRILVGDSVSRTLSRTLREIARHSPDTFFLPILTTLKAPRAHWPFPIRQLRETFIHAHAAAAGALDRKILFSRTEEEFIAHLLRARLHVTGRFHAVCFCLFTGTPFLAVDSNSWKIAALLDDFGLGRQRLVTVEELRERLVQGGGEDYSDEERAKIEAGLRLCAEKARDLFGEIAGLARDGGDVRRG